jgi:hypothetical protein
MGSSVKRKAVRHYLGRVYGTLACMALGVTVYDSQCGAKVFRVNEALVAAISAPFHSSWSFDVELIHRLLRGSGPIPGLSTDAFTEMPLDVWHDVEGSKLRMSSAVFALFDLASIARSRRDRARATHVAGEERPRARVIAPQLRTDARRGTAPSSPGERRRKEA